MCADKLALDVNGNSVHPYIAVTSGATQRFGFVKMTVNRTHMTLDAIPVDWNYNTSEGGAAAAAAADSAGLAGCAYTQHCWPLAFCDAGGGFVNYDDEPPRSLPPRSVQDVLRHQGSPATA